MKMYAMGHPAGFQMWIALPWLTNYNILYRCRRGYYLPIGRKTVCHGGKEISGRVKMFASMPWAPPDVVQQGIDSDEEVPWRM